MLGTFAQKMRFLQEFLDLHGSDADFSSWRSDSALIWSYLQSSTSSSTPSAQSSSSPLPATRPSRPSRQTRDKDRGRDRDRPRDHDRGRDRDRVPSPRYSRGDGPAPGSSGKICKSRVDPTYGRCKRSLRCPHSHDCVKPGCDRHCNAQSSPHFVLADAKSVSRKGVGE